MRNLAGSVQFRRFPDTPPDILKSYSTSFNHRATSGLVLVLEVIELKGQISISHPVVDGASLVVYALSGIK